MDYAISAEGLGKRYGSRWANRDISLSVPQGSVFALLGPNGAGKSTLVKTLVGLVRASAGHGALLGRPLGDVAARRQLGFLPELFRYYEWLSAAEVVDVHGRLYGMPGRDRRARVVEVLELVGLTSSAGQRVRTFSKGMQQRLGLACALVNRPSLVFLDEPTSALDPIGRRDVREIIAGLRQQGATVFLNSHLLSEVEMVCDQVAFIRQGQIVAQGPLEAMLESKLEVRLRVSALSDALTQALTGLGTLESARSAAGQWGPVQVAPQGSPSRERGQLVVLHLPNEEAVPLVARAVLDSGADLYALTPVRRSLEELFVELTEGGARS